MAVSKSEVISVRVEPRIKVALQTMAEHELRSVANMIEVMVVAYCQANGVPVVRLSKVNQTPGKEKK